jgi:hypothetical protein
VLWMSISSPTFAFLFPNMALSHVPLDVAPGLV